MHQGELLTADVRSSDGRIKSVNAPWNGVLLCYVAEIVKSLHDNYGLSALHHGLGFDLDEHVLPDEDCRC